MLSDKQRIEQLESALDTMWRKVLSYPFPTVCKNLIAARILSEMEQLGFEIPAELANYVVTCEDEKALDFPKLKMK